MGVLSCFSRHVVAAARSGESIRMAAISGNSPTAVGITNRVCHPTEDGLSIALPVTILGGCGGFQPKAGSPSESLINRVRGRGFHLTADGLPAPTNQRWATCSLRSSRSKEDHPRASL